MAARIDELSAGKKFGEGLGMRLGVWFMLACALLGAIELPPAAVTAFDRYTKIVEAEQAKQLPPMDFLWIQHHETEKSRIWLNQQIVLLAKPVLDAGKPIEVPGAEIQDWFGVVFLEHAALERARDYILNFPEYKTYFTDQIIDSKLVKRDGDHFDALFRLHRRQVLPVLLNVSESAQWTLVDPADATLVCRSTHIGESKEPGKKKRYDVEKAPGDENGYLWRMNQYWRLREADNGVYVELELVTLSREGNGGLRRYLNGISETYPQQLARSFLEDLRESFHKWH